MADDIPMTLGDKLLGRAADVLVNEDDQQIKVTLPDGVWWCLKRRLTRGDRRRIDYAVQTAALAFAKRLRDQGMSLSDLAAPSDGGARVVQASPANPDEDDALLVQGAISWSHNMPITSAAIEGRPEWEIDAILAVMHAAYTRTADEKRGLNARRQNGSAEAAG